MRRPNSFRVIGRTVAVIPLLLVALAFGANRPASAAPYSCTGDVSFTTIKGNLVVPSGSDCTLYGVMVTGSVTVQPNGYFYAESNSGVRTEIRGSISAANARTFGIYDLTVRGSVTTTNAGYVYVGFSELRSGLTVSGTVYTFEVSSSTIRGSVVLSNNTKEEPSAENWFFSNDVRGSVTCRNNVALDFWGNSIRGATSDECLA